MLLQSQIVTILDKALNQSAKLRKGGSQALYYCKCGHHKRKLEVSLENFIFHCWVCNKKGTLSGLLHFFGASSTYRDSLFKLTGDIRLARKTRKKTLSTDVVLPEEFRLLHNQKPTLESRNALAYLKRRKISQEDIIRYNIGYCESGPYAYHIIIPSYDSKNNLNFFIGRRYYDSEGTISHKKPEVSMDLVGFENFVNYNDPPILVEGAFNAITIRRNAIPLFGKFPSKKLREAMIVNGVESVYVFLDSDATQEAISVCEQLLRLGITPYMVTPQGGKDANEIGFEKSWECINNAKEVDFSFLLKNRLDL